MCRYCARETDTGFLRISDIFKIFEDFYNPISHNRLPHFSPPKPRAKPRKILRENDIWKII